MILDTDIKKTQCHTGKGVFKMLRKMKVNTEFNREKDTLPTKGTV